MCQLSTEKSLVFTRVQLSPEKSGQSTTPSQTRSALPEFLRLSTQPSKKGIDYHYLNISIEGKQVNHVCLSPPPFSGYLLTWLRYAGPRPICLVWENVAVQVVSNIAWQLIATTVQELLNMSIAKTTKLSLDFFLLFLIS